MITYGKDFAAIGVMILVFGLTLAEDKIPESTEEIRNKINDAACDTIGNKACIQVFQACMAAKFDLFTHFGICSTETNLDLKNKDLVFSGFCEDRKKGLTEANSKALKCVCDKLMKFGGEAVLEGIKDCAKDVKEKCVLPK